MAVEQSTKPEPACTVSVLMFHDSIELFLELASEHLDKGKSGANFMDYWELLKPRIGGTGLTQKESARQLNTARVGLKHSGIPPSKLALEGFRATATNFFVENTPIVFGIDFSDISLIELVQYVDAKNSLVKAQDLLEEGKIEDALDNVALAFAQLVDEYERSKKDKFGRSPFFFGERLSFLDSFFMKIEGDLGRFIDKIKDSVEALQEAMKLLSLDLDYRRYARFRLLTPFILKISGGYNIQRIQRGSKGLPKPEDVKFCINFVIESALVLQEFEFALEED
ncbi:MAG: hypothetical protein NWE91_02295 [Candidatus Bathyarchaeota archaeon]|nr:hypothetical protein [Candidatus Bathyarchaeota archaeon]